MESVQAEQAPVVDVNERMRALLTRDRPAFNAFCETIGLDPITASQSLLAEVQVTPVEGLRD